MADGQRLEAVDARQVQVGGYVGERIELTWRENLLALDWEQDFLRPFREKRGEGSEYVGMGKTLEGLVRLAGNTREPRLAALRGRVIDTLLGTQEADGYLGTYRRTNRIDPLWDVHELSYVLLALVVDWQYFGQDRSLRAARKLGDYLLAAFSGRALESIGRGQVCPELSMLGLDRALLALHRVTGAERYLRFCVDVLKLGQWDRPIVEGRSGKIEGHAYAYLTRCLAQLDLYELTGAAHLLGQSRRLVDYLRGRGGLLITGSCSLSECWHSDQTGTGELEETCATAYLIRWLGRLLSLNRQGFYGDWIERALYNALFAAQSPDGRRLRYYTPLEGERKYFERDTYCCPGNFRRIMGELPGMIYYRQDNGLVVNLYTASSATVKLASGVALKVEQQTDYPRAGEVVLRIEPRREATFSVALRKPGWCEQFDVEVNDQRQTVDVRDGFATIERRWAAGDTVRVVMAMPWRLSKGFAKQAGRAAVMRGPVLYCLNPSHNKMTGEDLDAAELVAGQTVTCRLGKGASDAGRVLELTAFVDPGGTRTYLPVADGDGGSADELLRTAGDRDA